MIKMFLLSLLYILSAADDSVLLIDDHEYSLQGFYSRYPKKQWERSDSLQKDKMFTDFSKRELCVLEAKKLGFNNDPDLAVKVRARSLQILVNESYEHFVARPLIAPDDLNAARNNAKKEVLTSHILVGHAGSYLGKPPSRTLDEAFILAQNISKEFSSGESFDYLAGKYSDDPSVTKNSGSLGWVQWGATVPEFQSVAFAADIGVLSDPVLTDFGYHLVLIADVRPSDFQFFSDEAYENIIFNLTKNTVRDRLRDAALEYDLLQIVSHDVLFNIDVINKIVSAYSRLDLSSLASRGLTNASSLLKSFNNLGVVCVYDGKGYGPLWFASRIGRAPSSRQPTLNSEDGIVAAFKTIILQDIAIKDGFAGGVNASFSYMQKVDEMTSGLLYDTYLKYLVNSASKPDSFAVVAYYNKNKSEKWMEPEKYLINEIRVDNKSLADSLLSLVRDGADFSSLANNYSLAGLDNGGLYGPFGRGENASLFDAASLLSYDEISPVLSVRNNNFSIIKLIAKIPPLPLELSRVYTRIESLLLKENQNNAKTDGVDGLLKKYKVVRRLELLGR